MKRDLRQKVLVLGSTGSMGRQALNVLFKHQDKFVVAGIAANKSKTALHEQAKKLKLPAKFAHLDKTQILSAISDPKIDIILNLVSGLAGLDYSLHAQKHKKLLLLANKESIVAAGKKLNYNSIIPLDSEHNAIYEILLRNPAKKIKKLYLPATGGPFLGQKRAQLKDVTVENALSHPSWKMGAKITVESATLINKGLEIIEAHYLFKTPLSKIDTFLCPKANIHGLVYFTDGTKSAYTSPPSMEEHIENALLRSINITPKNHTKILTEESPLFPLKSPDHKTFPGIKIVLSHFKKSPDKMKDFLKKEELTINYFLEGKIPFLQIYERLK